MKFSLITSLVCLFLTQTLPFPKHPRANKVERFQWNETQRSISPLSLKTDMGYPSQISDNSNSVDLLLDCSSGSEITYISDMVWEEETYNGWGPPERDQSNGSPEENDGQELRIGTTVYSKGIGTHSSDLNGDKAWTDSGGERGNEPDDDISRVVIRLDGMYDRFISDVGLDNRVVNSPTSAEYMSIEFVLVADGRQIYSSGVLFPGAGVRSIDEDISGVKVLELQTLNGNHGNASTGNFKWGDHGVWGGARVERCTLPDLLFGNVGDPSETLFPGSDFSLSYQIRNEGDLSSPSTDMEVSLIGFSGIVGSETVPSLNPGSNSGTRNATINLPSSLNPGIYTLEFEVNPRRSFDERSYDNNTVRKTITIEELPTPDIAISNVNPEEDSIYPGDDLTLNFNASNSGGVSSGEIGVRVDLNGTDLSPQPSSLAALGVNRSRAESTQVTIPEGTNLGSYTLTISLEEPNDKNTSNNSRSVKIEVIERPPTGPDIALISLSVDSTSICQGNVLNVSMEVENKGDEYAGTFLVGASLNNSPLIPNPTALPGGVAVGSTEIFTTALTIPSDATIGPGTLSLTLHLGDDIEASNDSDSTILTIKDCPIVPPCTFTITPNIPSSHTVGQGETSQPSIQVSEVSQVEQVNFLYRDISAFDTSFSVQPLTPDGDMYTASLADTDFGPIGLSYRFQVLGLGCEDKTESGHIYLSYPDPGLTLTPSIAAGREEMDYKMIAVPLNLDSRSFQNTFGDELLDDENKTKWRFMRFNGSSTVDHTSNIDPGLGYWILSTFATSLQSGAGTTVQVTEDNPFSIALTPNDTFTQIGNPYNFKVSWEDVLAENEASRSLLKLLTFNRGWDSLEVLSPFQGAFVQNNAGLNRIHIPVKRNPNVNRLGNYVSRPSLDAPAWKVGIKLETQELIHNVSGFGMHPRASTGIDEQDMKGLPRFSTFLDLNFPVENHPNKAFRENYVATQDSYSWDMEIASNGGDPIKVSWENEYFGNNEKELWLENLQTGQVLDMRKQTTLHIKPQSEKSLFRIHFGPLAYVQSQVGDLFPWIGEPYPNPSSDRLSFELFIPHVDDPIQIKATLYSMIGQKVAEKVWRLSSPSHQHRLKWRVATQVQSKGMYLYKISIESSAGVKESLGSVLLE